MITREVRLVSLPMTAPLTAAHGAGPDRHRELTLVRLVDDDGAEGWGECAALDRPGYTDEWARGAFAMLSSGAVPDPADHPLAAAALEMALIDLDLRRRGIALAEYLGLPGSPVAAGATIGLAPVAETVARAAMLVAAGYRRLKVKISPAGGLDAVAAIRSEHPGVELHVDANGSFAGDSVATLAGLDDHGVAVIEQPFGFDDVEASAALRARVEARVFVDEGGRPWHRVERAAEAHAIDGVVVKPGCVGGMVTALAILTWCGNRGLDAAIGGMVESGLGRATLAVVAGHPAATVVGDVSPASLWIDGDPWPALTMADGTVNPPTAAGVCGTPDRDRLAALTVAVTSSTPDH